MAKSNTIVESVSKTDQDVSYQLIEASDGHKIKFDVRSNSLKDQCHARVYVWNNGTQTWNLVHYIFPHEMNTSNKLVYGGEPASATDFQQDVTELRRVALAVLS